jgi:uncharacterized protein YutE (UPF0331/DUF86 family)
MPPAAAAPLETNDLDRARALKTKIRDRISDVRRHLLALRAAMAEFGEDFDLDAFTAAYDSEDPAELNRVKAVERGVDQLYNYIAELAAYGLELAGVRTRAQETNARVDLDALARIGVIGPERKRRLQRLRELRRLLVHEYATATAEQVHEAAGIIDNEFIRSTTPTATGSAAASVPPDLGSRIREHKPLTAFAKPLAVRHSEFWPINGPSQRSDVRRRGFRLTQKLAVCRASLAMGDPGFEPGTSSLSG